MAACLCKLHPEKWPIGICTRAAAGSEHVVLNYEENKPIQMQCGRPPALETWPNGIDALHAASCEHAMCNGGQKRGRFVVEQ